MEYKNSIKVCKYQHEHSDSVEAYLSGEYDDMRLALAKTESDALRQARDVLEELVGEIDDKLSGLRLSEALSELGEQTGGEWKAVEKLSE